MTPRITKAPEDRDNAAPDWMVISRGRFRDNSAAYSSMRQTGARQKKREVLIVEGYVQLGIYARESGISYDVLYKRCRAGTVDYKTVEGRYWIRPGEGKP